MVRCQLLTGIRVIISLISLFYNTFLQGFLPQLSRNYRFVFFFVRDFLFIVSFFPFFHTYIKNTFHSLKTRRIRSQCEYSSGHYDFQILSGFPSPFFSFILFVLNVSWPICHRGPSDIQYLHIGLAFVCALRSDYARSTQLLYYNYTFTTSSLS